MVKIKDQHQFLDTYGIDYAKIMWVEKINELLRAIRIYEHNRIYGHNKQDLCHKHLIKELTDILICIEQMKTVYTYVPVDIIVSGDLEENLFNASQGLCRHIRFPNRPFNSMIYIQSLIITCNYIRLNYTISDEDIQKELDKNYEREVSSVEKIQDMFEANRR